MSSSSVWPWPGSFAGLLRGRGPLVRSGESGGQGNIIVRSTPTGAAIFLDGVDQNTVTPDTLRNLDPGTYEVTVELTDHDPDPAMVTVDLASAETDSAVFTLTPSVRAKKMVILEGFTNVSCPPCPELTENLVAMMAKPEFTRRPGAVHRVRRVLARTGRSLLPGQSRRKIPTASPGTRCRRAPDLYIDGVRQATPWTPPPWKPPSWPPWKKIPAS